MFKLKRRLDQHLTMLCKTIGERHLGSEGARKAARYLRIQWKEMGYRVVEETFAAPGWRYGKYSLSLENASTEIPCFPCFYSNSCDTAGKLLTLRAEDLGRLDSLGVKGRICFAATATEVGAVGGRNHLAEALDRLGATALIVISNYSDTENTKIIRSAFLKHLAVVTVNSNTAYEIARNERKRFRLKVQAKNFSTKGRNVIARVKGKGKPRKIVFGAHYDTSPGISGACDNASGTAALLEVARLLKGRLKGCAADFVAFDAEEYGGVTGGALGSRRYLERHVKELARIQWMCNLDDVGHLTGQQIAYVAGTEGFQHRVIQALRGYATLMRPTNSAAGDAGIFQRHDVPTIDFNYGAQNHVQIHSPQDTMDKLDPGRLARVCKTAAGMTERLLSERLW